MAKILIHARVPEDVVAKVYNEVKKRWSVDSQSEAIARALENWVFMIDREGKGAKLDELLVDAKLRQSFDVQFERFVAQRFNDVVARLDASDSGRGDFDGCDNPPGSE